jgi:hypothetical protein
VCHSNGHAASLAVTIGVSSHDICRIGPGQRSVTIHSRQR